MVAREMELARFETMHENSRGRFASQSEEDEHLEYHSDTLEEPTFPQVLGAPQKNVKLQKMHKTCRKKCKKKRSSVAGGAAGSKIANSDGSPLSGIHKNIQQRRSDHFSPNLTDSSIVSSNDSRSRFPCDDAFESPKTGRYLQAQFNDDNEKLLSGFYDDEDDDRDEPKVLKYIDTHCHLDLLFHRTKCLNKCDEYSLDDFRMKPEIVRTWSPNFGGCITDFCFPEDNSYSKALNSVKKCDDVWTAIGCHPHSADKYTTQLEAQIYQLASDPKVVAVGEMGLDESKNNNTKPELQRKALEGQVKIARKLNKPILLHCRNAENDCWKIFRTLVPHDYKIHWHCYSETWAAAQKWQTYFTNIYFGVTLGLYSPRVDQEEFWRNCPSDRLVIETDSPYFLPRHYNRSLSHCHPGLGALVALKLAGYRTEKIANILKQMLENTRKLYGIHP